jgi:hypothetical protein
MALAYEVIFLGIKRREREAGNLHPEASSTKHGALPPVLYTL